MGRNQDLLGPYCGAAWVFIWPLVELRVARSSPTDAQERYEVIANGRCLVR